MGMSPRRDANNAHVPLRRPREEANRRINEFGQRTLGLRDDPVHNNIQKYGNTTAATIPLCLEEAISLGKVKKGDLVCAVAFGGGFTWGSVLMRW